MGRKKNSWFFVSTTYIRFLFESLIISVIAVTLSLCIIEILLPSFSSLMGTKIVFRYDLGTFAIISECVYLPIIVRWIRRILHVIAKSGFSLKSASQTGSKEGLRKTLLVLQFTLSILIILCTLIVYSNWLI